MNSQYKKTIVIGMDYSEFSGGITEINRKMGLLDAELKRATAEADLYGDSTDKLGVQQDVLRQKIELQKQKVEEAAKSYDKIVTAHGYESKAADQADKALLNERTTLLKLEGALKDTEDQIEDTSDETRSFGDTIRDVANFIGVEANPMVEKFAEKFDDVDANVGKAVLTLGTIGTALGSLTLSTADHAKEISVVSQRMGMTTDQYQEWDYIMKMVGSDAESMTGDIAALAEKALDATDKTSDTAKTFRLLGVNVRDSHGALKSQNELFNDVIRGLQNMEDVTKRNAIASDLLSTTGENLGPILNMTSKEIANLKREAHLMGYVISEESIEKFIQLKEAMNNTKTIGEGLANSFAAALLPVLTTLFSAISAIPTPVLTMIITLTGMIAAMVSIGKAVESTIGTFGKFGKFLTGFDFKANQTAMVIFGVVLALAALAAVIAVIIGKGNELDRTMTVVGNSVSNIQSTAMSGRTQHYALGTDYADGGEAWIGEHGPERVILPRGSRVLTAEETRRSSGGDTYNLYATIPARDIKEWNDVVNFMQQGKQAARAGRSKL